MSISDLMLEDQKHFLPLHLSTSNGLELAADETGSLQLIEHTRPGAKQWLCFQSNIGGIALESVFGRFLCAEPTGSIVANRPWQDCWELFELEVNPLSHSRINEAPSMNTCERASFFEHKPSADRYLVPLDNHKLLCSE
jgi:hypothetical protein